MDEQPASVTRESGIDPPRTFDYSYTHDDGIKESFLSFSLKINDLDKQLGTFTNKCLQLGRVAGLLLAIKSAREMLRRTREVFFRNAAELVPELYGMARKDCYSTFRDTNDVHYFIPPQYFVDPLPPFDVLPNVLEQLAHSFSLFHLRIDEFREFTDEGLFLKSLLLTLERDLMYRASCVKVYSGCLNTPPIQRYIHQFIDELRIDFEKMTTALSDFTDVGVSAINHEQQRSSQNLTNILTVATFFSGVTAGTLAMSTGMSTESSVLQIASMLWFASLVFSVGAALNSLLAMAWKETRSGSRGAKMPFWVTMWIDGSQLLFLGISIVTFSAGLIVFAFASGQAFYTPYVTIGATGITSIGLVAILIWLIYEISVSPVLVRKADVIKSSAESVHSEVSKFSLGVGLRGALSNALVSLGLPTLSRGQPREEVEMLEEKDTPGEEHLSREVEPTPVAMKARLQANVKNLSVLNTVTSAFISAGNQRKRSHLRTPTSPRNKLQLETNVPTAPMTQLYLPTEPSISIDLSRYGLIRDVAYSSDGKWLAVACSKDNTGQSWTAVYHSEGLESYADTWHEGRVFSERLVWSPSGEKLIVKFEHRFDVWDLIAKDLRIIERHHNIKDVQWYGDDAFLVAEHNCVFKMDPTRLLAVYRFDHMHVRSIGLERKNNYLIVIVRVTKSPEQIEPASSRSEKRIVIYNMDKQEAIYRVPVLENISNIYPIQGELDILVTHKEKKAFQLWYLDAGMKGSDITARLKKRAVIPQPNPGDYVGPTCIGGNYSQFVLNTTASGAIDIWHRESGLPYMRFEAKKLQEEGVACLSWKKSIDNTATFATAGIASNVLHIWRGEEPVISRTSSTSDFPQVPESREAVKEAPRKLWQQAMSLARIPSSETLSGGSNKV